MRLENDRTTSRRMEQEIRDRLTVACAFLSGEVQLRAPVDTGNLKASVSFEVRGRKGIVFNNSEYAVYQEFGTGVFAENGRGRKDRWLAPITLANGEQIFRWTNGQPGTMHMRPAFDENLQQLERILLG